MKIDDVILDIKKKLEYTFKENFTGLVLFGSYAKKNAKKTSDIDILITFKNLPNSKMQRNELISDFLIPFEKKYKKKINAKVGIESNLSKTILICDIAEYAKIIVDKNKKIKNLFKSVQEDYRKGHIKKIMNDDHYRLEFVENV